MAESDRGGLCIDQSSDSFEYVSKKGCEVDRGDLWQVISLLTALLDTGLESRLLRICSGSKASSLLRLLVAGDGCWKVLFLQIPELLPDRIELRRLFVLATVYGAVSDVEV